MSGPTPDQLRRVQDWIRSEAAAKSIDDIHAYVSERYDRLSAAVTALPAGTLTITPPGEDWTPIHALKHVVEWNWQVGEDVLHVCLTGERPNNPPPEFPAEREPLLARNRESLDSIFAHVSAADPAGFLHVTWEHPFFGQLNWREWFLFLAVHATDHAGQIRTMSDGANA